MNEGNANDTRVNIAKLWTSCQQLRVSNEGRIVGYLLIWFGAVGWLDSYADSICLWFYSMNMNGFVCNHLYGTDFIPKNETIAKITNKCEWQFETLEQQEQKQRTNQRNENFILFFVQRCSGINCSQVQENNEIWTNKTKWQKNQNRNSSFWLLVWCQKQNKIKIWRKKTKDRICCLFSPFWMSYCAGLGIELRYISIPTACHCFTNNDFGQRKSDRMLWINKEPTQRPKRPEIKWKRKESEIQLTINVRICFLFAHLTLPHCLRCWIRVYMFVSVWFWLNF